MSKNKVVIFFVISVIVSSVIGAHIPSENSEDKKGLYGNDSNVKDLYGEELKASIFHKDYAIYVEFYNSFCGYCRRFAPKWKSVAKHVSTWKTVVRMFAFDCSQDENNDLCREFEVMAYPSIRYFSPNYSEGSKKIGVPIEHHEEEELIEALGYNLVAEKNPPKNWPDLKLNKIDNINDIFNDFGERDLSTVKYAILVIEKSTGNKTIGIQTILELCDNQQLLIRRISSESKFVSTLNLSYSNYAVVAVDRKFNKETIMLTEETREVMLPAIKEHLNKHSIRVESSNEKNVDTNKNKSSNQNIENVMNEIQDQAILEKLKMLKGVIFRADIEQAVRFSLFHEVLQSSVVSGDKLGALRRLAGVLKKYFPFNEEGKKFIENLDNYLNQEHTEIKSEELKAKLNDFQSPNMLSSNRYVGCFSKQSGLRRYPCSLWTTFHFLTVQAAASDKSDNPIEILHALYDYIKNYFGCTMCKKHFLAMAARNMIWNVTSKDEAVLWLWSSHNEVNKRLSGDITEDPDFKKIQFPSQEMCPECRNNDDSNNSETISWNRDAVLVYLKRIYSLENLNDLGTENEYLIPTAEKFKQESPLFTNMFSDLDIRMGILLYICMICIMIVSVKLLIKRRYRKKLYVHDILGKV